MALTVNEVRGARAERVLLLVHGLGADEHDLAPLVPYLDPDGRFLTVIPRGPYPMPPGYAWFGFDAGGADPTTFMSSVDLIDDLLDDACEQMGTPRSQSVLAGFSQGAMLALAAGLRADGRRRPAGVLAMSGALPAVAGLDIAWDESPMPQVLVQHGTHDPLIPVDRGRKAARDLAAHELDVEFREYPMGHEVSLASIEDARDWIQQLLADRPT